MPVHHLAHSLRWRQWLVLLILSCIFLVLFEWMHLPAALMFGPMVAGIVVGLRGASIRVPSRAFKAAQSIIGCMLAITITPAVISGFFEHWFLLICIIFFSIFCSCAIGLVLTYLRVMPGSTAIWGSTPGAASTMIIIAQDYGADIRLVAFMQYFRVLLVSLATSLVAWSIEPVTPADSAVAVNSLQNWFTAIDIPAFASMLGVALVGTLLATALHVPAAGLIGPLLLGGLLHGLGWIDMQIPTWLLVISFTLLGWRVGLIFDRDTLNHVYKALPAITLSTIILMLFCGFLSWVLTMVLHLDPLTAYLANTPGGLEAVAAIAASRPETNISFIMSLQTARLILLTAICPPLTKWIANRFH